MSNKEQQVYDVASETSGDGDGNLSTQLAIICTAWILGALLLGIAFVAFSDVFAGILG